MNPVHREPRRSAYVSILFYLFLTFFFVLRPGLNPTAIASKEGFSCRKLFHIWENTKKNTRILYSNYHSKMDQLQNWSQRHKGWFKVFNKEEFIYYRQRYQELLAQHFPSSLGQSLDSKTPVFLSDNQAVANNGNGNKGLSDPIVWISSQDSEEQKIAFIEALALHFISPSNQNPLKAKNVIESHWLHFLKKRKFFKRLRSLNFSTLKRNDLEEIFIDLYVFKNFRNSHFPNKMMAILDLISPFTRKNRYENWYRNAILKRFYTEVLFFGFEPAMEKLNMPIESSYLRDNYNIRQIRQTAQLGVAAVVNWYLLLPLIDFFGYVHFPEFNTLEWINLGKAIRQKVSEQPELIGEIIDSEFEHEFLHEWMKKYGISHGGVRAKFDLIYGTLRQTYLSLFLVPAIYFSVAQFGWINSAHLEKLMRQMESLRINWIPSPNRHLGEVPELDSLVKPDDW